MKVTDKDDKSRPNYKNSDFGSVRIVRLRRGRKNLMMM